MVRLTYLLIICSLFVPFSLVQAEPLLREIKAFTIRFENGQEQRQQVEEAAPGSIVEYEFYYRNQGDVSLRDLTVNLPLPNFASFIAASARSSVNAELNVSVDQAQNWQAEPIKRTAYNEQGQAYEETVPASEYTHLQWKVLELMKPGDEYWFHYRVNLH